MGIKLYDTVKDKSGKRFRVTETKNDGTGHIMAALKGINPDGSARRGMPRRVRLDVLESEYTRINLAPVEVKKIDDLRKEETKVTQVPTPSDKALEKQKEAVRALSEKEVEEALTKSTYGGKKLEPLDEDDNIIKDIEAENERLRRDNLNLRRTVEELRNVRTGMAECNKDIEVLKTECLDLKEDKKKLLREIDDYKKTISKMKYAHEEEIRALEDELAEAKALAKKGNEYSDRLADNEETFRKMRAFSKSIVGMADSIEGLAYLIQDEAEGRI